ncbi:cytochrome b pre-mRNA-processing protein 3 [Pseudochelatococcus lubricantis]|uniref:Cytochrome b pre-mRNA-processing protein 3 n=1 Tax=Pseudochelatococcus lubricantis TaxID=1538102 RepID=A0ABX0UY72_9HYPH|nr:ubiquinol-cytochrome C chaperone family protein [Pseudochelatococcus lubricantis]NIJ56545.1 cytochrome b pre-mRNA-processing protein 3 [Pseudochelatococcus lubricantis]
MKLRGEMFFGLFGRKRDAGAVEALYRRISDASRAPFLYTHFGVPDTLEGRFDSLTLHTVLTMRRLRGLPPPAADVAQDLVDILFREIDRSLREIGIGDLSVPKKMKVFAETFYGRARVFEKALAAADDEALHAALSRPAGEKAGNLADFARHIRHADATMTTYDLAYIMSGAPLFPDAPRS